MKRTILLSLVGSMVVPVALGLAVARSGDNTAAKVEEPTSLRALYGLKPVAALSARRTALLLVDFQNEFFTGKLPLPDARPALARAVALSNFARASGIRVVHVSNVVNRANSPLFAPSSVGAGAVRELAPRVEDWRITKSMAGAFSHTDLDQRLREQGIDTLIVAGLMTHLAVAVTANDANVLGYRVVVAADATATRTLPAARTKSSIEPTPRVNRAIVEARILQSAALAALADRAAEVLPTQEILALPLEP